MRWEFEPWLKLYKRCDAKWLNLPVSARGLTDELLKYRNQQTLADPEAT